MMRSLSTSAFGQPSDTKETRGAGLSGGTGLAGSAGISVIVSFMGAPLATERGGAARRRSRDSGWNHRPICPLLLGGTRGALKSAGVLCDPSDANMDRER